MSGAPGVRLFAALELPGPARAALASWAARVVGQEPAVRLLPVTSLHVTMVFLGTQPLGEVAAIADAVTRSARPLGLLEVSRAAWLPPRRPGVLVADLAEAGDGTALAALHAGLVTALTPWHEPETRGFRPHVTVARVRRDATRLAAAELVAGPPALSFAARGLVLYRSHTGGGEPRYEELARAALA